MSGSKRRRSNSLDGEGTVSSLPKQSRGDTRLVIVTSPQQLKEDTANPLQVCYTGKWQTEEGGKPISLFISFIRAPQVQAAIQLTFLKPGWIWGEREYPQIFGISCDEQQAKVKFICIQKLFPKMCTKIFNLIVEDQKFALSEEEQQNALEQMQKVILDTNQVDCEAVVFLKNLATSSSFNGLQWKSKTRWWTFLGGIYEAIPKGVVSWAPKEEALNLLELVSRLRHVQTLPHPLFLCSILCTVATHLPDSLPSFRREEEGEPASTWSEPEFEILMKELPASVYERPSWFGLVITLCPATAQAILLLQITSRNAPDTLLSDRDPDPSSVLYAHLVQDPYEVGALMANSTAWFQWWENRILSYYATTLHQDAKHVELVYLLTEAYRQQLVKTPSWSSVSDFFARALVWALERDYQSTGVHGMDYSLVQICLMLGEEPLCEEDRATVVTQQGVIQFLSAPDLTVDSFFDRLCHLAQRYPDMGETVPSVIFQFPDEVMGLLAPHLCTIPYAKLVTMPNPSQQRIRELLVRLYYTLPTEQCQAFLESIPTSTEATEQFLGNLFDELFLPFHTKAPNDLQPSEVVLVRDQRLLSTETFISSDFAREFTQQLAAGTISLAAFNTVFPGATETTWPSLRFMMQLPFENEEQVKERLQWTKTVYRDYQRMYTLQREIGLVSGENEATLNAAESLLMDSFPIFQQVIHHPFRRVIATQTHALLARYSVEEKFELVEEAVQDVMKKVQHYQGEEPLAFFSLSYLTSNFTTYTQEELMSLLRDHSMNLVMDDLAMKIIDQAYKFHSLIELSVGLSLFFHWADLSECPLAVFCTSLPPNLTILPIQKTPRPTQGEYDLTFQAYTCFPWIAMHENQIRSATTLRPGGAVAQFLRMLPTQFAGLKGGGQILDHIHLLNTLLEESAFLQQFRSCQSEVEELAVYPSSRYSFVLSEEEEMATLRTFQEGQALVSPDVPIHRHALQSNRTVQQYDEDRPFPRSFFTVQEEAQLENSPTDLFLALLQSHIPQEDLGNNNGAPANFLRNIHIKVSSRMTDNQGLDLGVSVVKDQQLHELLAVCQWDHSSQLIIIQPHTSWEYLVTRLNRMYLPSLKIIKIVGLEQAGEPIHSSLITYLQSQNIPGPQRATLQFIVSEAYHNTWWRGMTMRRIPLSGPKPPTKSFLQLVSSRGQLGCGKTKRICQDFPILHTLELGGRLDCMSLGKNEIFHRLRGGGVCLSWHGFMPEPQETQAQWTYREECFLFNLLYFGKIETESGLYLIPQEALKSMVVELHTPSVPKIFELFTVPITYAPYLSNQFLVSAIPRASIHQYLRHHPDVDPREVDELGRVSPPLCVNFVNSSQQPLQSYCHAHRFIELASCWYDALVSQTGEQKHSQDTHRALELYCGQRMAHGPQQATTVKLLPWMEDSPLLHRWQQACTPFGLSVQTARSVWHACEYLLCDRPLILDPSTPSHANWNAILHSLAAFLELANEPVRCKLSSFSTLDDIRSVLDRVLLQRVGASSSHGRYNRMLVFEQVEHAPALWTLLYEMMYQHTIHGVRIPLSVCIMGVCHSPALLSFPVLEDAVLGILTPSLYSMNHQHYAQEGFRVLTKAVHPSQPSDELHFARLYHALSDEDPTNVPLLNLRSYLKESGGSLAKDYVLITSMLVFRDRLSPRACCQLMSKVTLQATEIWEQRWEDVLRYVSTIFTPSTGVAPSVLQNAPMFVRCLLMLMLNVPMVLLGPAGVGKSLACHLLQRFYQNQRRIWLVSDGWMGSSPRVLWDLTHRAKALATKDRPVTMVLDNLTSLEYERLLPLLSTPDEPSYLTLILIPKEDVQPPTWSHVLHYHVMTDMDELVLTMKSIMPQGLPLMREKEMTCPRDYLATASFYHSWASKHKDAVPENPYHIVLPAGNVSRTWQWPSSPRYWAWISSQPPPVEQDPNTLVYDCTVMSVPEIIPQILKHANHPSRVYLMNVEAASPLWGILENLLKSKSWNASTFSLNYRLLSCSHEVHGDFQLYFHVAPATWQEMSLVRRALLQPIFVLEESNEEQLQEVYQTWTSALTTPRWTPPSNLIMEDIQPVSSDQLFVTTDYLYTPNECRNDSPLSLIQNIFYLRMHMNAFYVIPSSASDLSYEQMKSLHEQYVQPRTFENLLHWFKDPRQGSCYQSFHPRRPTVVFTFSPVNAVEDASSGVLGSDTLENEEQVGMLLGNPTQFLAVAEYPAHQSHLQQFIGMEETNPSARILVICLDRAHAFQDWMDRPSLSGWNQVFIEDVLDKRPPFVMSDSLASCYEDLSLVEWREVMTQASSSCQDVERLWVQVEETFPKEEQRVNWTIRALEQWSQQQQAPCHWMYEFSHSKLLSSLSWKKARIQYLIRVMSRALPSALLTPPDDDSE